MLSKFVESAILSSLDYEPTTQQASLLSALSEFVTTPDTNQIFLLKGYAGTGKTTLIGALVKAFEKLKQKVVLMAPTGRAAKVLHSYTEKQAFTIHKKIYRQKTGRDGIGVFVRDRNLHTYTLFIVDEASMIANQSYEQSVFGSGRLLDDLIEYVYEGSNCMLILVGDTAQLPPVGLPMSPALDKGELATYGFNVVEHELTDVVRQAKESGILDNSTLLREQVSEQAFSTILFPQIRTTGYPDVIKLTGTDLIETIADCYARYGMEDTMVISRSNKRANKYNQGIRNKILYKEDEISPGDLLMIVKNNYFWLTADMDSDELKNSESKNSFIANGDICEVVSLRRYEEMHGFRFADIEVRFLDSDTELSVKILVDTLHSDTASMSSEDNKKLYTAVSEDYAHISSRKKRSDEIRKDPFFNALQVKFAYAVTCHKAQGGQWKAIFVDQGYFVEDMLDVEYIRWLYTAFTRATERLYLVNFDKRFIDSSEQ